MKNFENNVPVIDTNTGIHTKFDHVPSRKELAQIGNTTVGCVCQALNKKGARCRENSKAHIVRSVAVNNGYALYADGTIRKYNKKEGVIVMKNAMQKPVDMNAYLNKSNFPSRKIRKERMLRLREQGYTNEEIARKVGVCHQTVINNIGIQPEAYTKQSVELRALRRKQATSARTWRVEALKEQKIEEQKKIVADIKAEQTGIILQMNAVDKKLKEAEEILRKLETA